MNPTDPASPGHTVAKALSKASTDFLTEVLRFGDDSQAGSVADEQLVRFLSGSLGPAEVERLTATLVASEGVRKRMLEVDAELARLRLMPWAEVQAIAGGERPESDIARLWTGEVGGYLMREWPTRSQSQGLQGWAAVIRTIVGAANVQEKLRSAASPLRGAITRGGDQRILAEIDSAGDLRLRIVGAAGPAVVELNAAPASWELGTTGPTGELRVPGFAAQTGLPAGPLPSSLFRVADGGAEGAWTVYADVEGVPQPIALRLPESPQVSGGVMRLRLDLPPAASRYAQTHVLQISLLVGPDVEQTLIRGDLAALTEAEGSVEVPLLTSTSPTTLPCPLLRIRLVRSES